LITSSNVVLTGASISGTNTISGRVIWDSGFILGDTSIRSNSVVIAEGSTDNLRVVPGVLRNSGSFALTGGTLLLNAFNGGAGTLYNLEESLLDFMGNQSIVAGAFGGRLVNSGVIRKSGGTNSTINVPFANDGVLDLEHGVLTISGDYQPSSSSTLRFSFDGTGTPQIQILATAALTGALDLRFSGPPAPGATFQILTAKSVTGAFTRVTGNYVGNGVYLIPQYQPSAVLLTARDATPHLVPSKDQLFFTNGAFHIEITGVNGKTYVTQASSDLVTWFPLSTNSFLQDHLDLLDTGSATNKHRFYRTLLLP